MCKIIQFPIERTVIGYKRMPSDNLDKSFIDVPKTNTFKSLDEDHMVAKVLVPEEKQFSLFDHLIHKDKVSNDKPVRQFPYAGVPCVTIMLGMATTYNQYSYLMGCKAADIANKRIVNGHKVYESDRRLSYGIADYAYLNSGYDEFY